MSKTKVKNVYRVQPASGVDAYVIARSPKGARSIAKGHGLNVPHDTCDNFFVTLTDPQFKSDAINRKVV
jgi:hypothetical protein